MEKLFLNIAQRLAAECPELTLLDEDCGQLQLLDGENDYPVTFPCALIDTGSMEWQHSKGGTLRGRGSVIVKIAHDCYEDTHYAAATTERLLQRLELNRRAMAALHGYDFGDDHSPMVATQSRAYSIYGRKKVCEITLAVNVTLNLTR